MRTATGLLTRIHIDGPLLFGLIVLCAIGLVTLHSAGGEDPQLLYRQGVRFFVGFVAMLVLAQIEIDKLARWAPLLYAFGLALLFVVLFFGSGKGVRRWLDLGVFTFQPSEVMKLAVPLVCAWYLSDRPLPPSLRRVIVTLLFIVVPVVLIALQPDLGTAVLIAATGLFILFLAGMHWRYICGAGLFAMVTAPLLWLGMKDYQRQRVLTLFDPEKDPLGSGYHIIQSQIAVGSGGLTGKGWLAGTQSRLEFVPERSTDFIFAVYCEEFGFIGVLLLLMVYLFVVLRALYIAAVVQDSFARLVGGSLALTFFLYVFVNMGMVIGQLPVVGVPLPLISYGGTSLVTLLAGFGILMSVHTHHRFLRRS